MDRVILRHLEEVGQLIHIEKQVSIVHEIAAYMRKSFDVGGPAFIFDDIKEAPRWRALGALYGTRDRVLEFYGAPDVMLAMKMFEDAIKSPAAYSIDDDGSHAPCRQNVDTSGTIAGVPLCKYSLKDNGFYITGGVQTAWDAKNERNVNGIFRMKLVHKSDLSENVVPAITRMYGRIPDGDYLTLNANPDRQLGRVMARAHEQNDSLDIAVPIGVDPSVVFASQAKVPETMDKYSIASRLQTYNTKEPLKVCQCRTIRAWVPENSEVVIECESIPDAYECDVPFGDFTGNYSLHGNVPLLKIKAVTWRNEPLYEPVMTGLTPTEDHLIGWIPASASYKRFVEALGSDVVGLDVKSDNVSEVHVSIKKRLEGEPLNVILTVLATHVKYCYVYDADINVFDDKDCKWAFLTRHQPERGCYVFPTMVGGNLDPSGKYMRHTSKCGFDCTVPLGSDPLKYERLVVPGSENVKLTKEHDEWVLYE